MTNLTSPRLTNTQLSRSPSGRADRLQVLRSVCDELLRALAALASLRMLQIIPMLLAFTRSNRRRRAAPTRHVPFVPEHKRANDGRGLPENSAANGRSNRDLQKAERFWTSRHGIALLCDQSGVGLEAQCTRRMFCL